MPQKHDLSKMPAGYRPVLWTEVQPHTEVYVQGIQNGLPHAYGPHLVADPENKQLQNIARREFFTHTGETLLVREGPLVVLTFNEGEFTGVYADVPLELAISTSDMDQPKRECSVRRPRAFSRIGNEHMDVLDASLPPGWPGFYGEWDIKKATTRRQQETEEAVDFEFRLDNRMAANALAIELMRTQHQFRVQPLDRDSFVFTISRETLKHIRQHCEDLTEGINRVTE